MVHPITSGSHIIPLWHKTQHPRPHLLLLYCCFSKPPWSCAGPEVFISSGTHKPNPRWMWQLGSCVTRWEDKISIFHLPFLPHSPTSVPEWHLAVASLHSCVILAPDKFQPCQGLEWFRNKESLSPITSVHHVDQKRQRN